VLVERRDVSVPEPVVLIRVPSTRAALGPLLHAFYGSPSLSLSVVGVTGTKGKTTVTWLIQHLLEACGLACGLIGSICARWRQEYRVFHQTTPPAAILQRTLAEMVHAEMQVCAMEVSSHALDQQRTDGIRWACGVFTNLDPEHMDYHGTMEAYARAKRRLFEQLPPEATAVLHRGDPRWEEMAGVVRGRVRTYGIGVGADFEAREIRMSLEGTRFELVGPGLRWPVESPLIGLHNVENVLAALGAVDSLHIPLEWAAQAVSHFPGVPGRLERIDVGQPFPVFVDYAHTERALRRVLGQLRQLTSRRIVTVFGCGGDRDRLKRPLMGRAAGELSDRVIVTSDNPRSEDPAQIAREILSGMQGVPAEVEVILDRREAIRAALAGADSRWLVLIAGKGHEEEQIFADRSVPFDDRQVVRMLLGERYAAGLVV
jgi:UDP-N-acetylmuramoyl-L-alanyl-D-glutamate--2,6-diaminopimelate ligase